MYDERECPELAWLTWEVMKAHEFEYDCFESCISDAEYKALTNTYYAHLLAEARGDVNNWRLHV